MMTGPSSELVLQVASSHESVIAHEGRNVLGYLMAVGAVVAVLAIIIIAGRMIHANFTGDPWIAARGVADLPYVLIALCLMVAAPVLVAGILSGAPHNLHDGGHPTDPIVEQQTPLWEREANKFCELFISRECFGGP